MFSGGLKKRLFKFRGALIIALVFSGGLFLDQRWMWNLVEKIQGGMHELLENSGGPIIVILPDLKEAPLNSQQSLGDCSQKRKRKVVFPRKLQLVYSLKIGSI